ncbi:hypothetical protein [Pseudomonas sp. UBA1879]|uniref:hypothetical protein n=1 Tax=Pseudomonas sp. UBA1879 TaxID=1947305 RepID=UPI0025E63B26|nr:hypothetical protein [Pseudomonas sp. UBA1879]
MLEDLGHRVQIASHGDESPALTREHTDFDLTIADHRAPTLSGAELAEHVSRLRPALAIITPLGFTDTLSPLAQRLPRLPKPFKQSELARAIASIGT